MKLSKEQERQIKKEVLFWLIKSYFKRLTFKRSFWSNIKLIFNSIGTWNLRAKIYLTKDNDLQTQRIIRKKREFKTVKPTDEGYYETLHAVVEEVEEQKPTFH